MTDESNSDGVLVIRAWRQDGGEFTARLTIGIEGEESTLNMMTVHSREEVVAAVRNWLNLIRT